jgi:hypothetical protein
VCFLAFAYVVLKYIAEEHPDTEKVDFIVERNGDVTKRIADSDPLDCRDWCCAGTVPEV